MPNAHLKTTPEVAEALGSGGAVVALESTIITHGMPYPRNVETALAVEADVRANGAVPATIAVIGGRLRAGLTHDEIDELGQRGEHALKVSRRDLPFIIDQGGIGGTTVAATMIVSNIAGISIFATGGIGGVHPGAGTSFDISADLQELARTDVTVICSGIKSILDIGLTLEYLETHGVPVVGFGTDMLPAFYTRESAFGVDYQIDSPAEAARIISLRRSLGLGGGMVVVNPIPQVASMDAEVIDAAIHQALGEAEAQGIVGKDTTPFLLGRIVEITGEASLTANIALVRNNAVVAAQIASAGSATG